MLCLFAIFNFWRAIFYSWTTTLFWTWILFSCLFCFHSYLLFSLYFYYLQFDFNYAKFVEKNNKQFVNNIGDMFALYYCTFLLMGFLGLRSEWQHTSVCWAGLSPLTTSATHSSNVLHLKTNIIRQNNIKFYIINQDRKADRAGLSPLTKCVLYLFEYIVHSYLWDSLVSLTLHSEWHIKNERKSRQATDRWGLPHFWWNFNF